MFNIFHALAIAVFWRTRKFSTNSCCLSLRILCWFSNKRRRPADEVGDEDEDKQENSLFSNLFNFTVTLDEVRKQFAQHECSEYELSVSWDNLKTKNSFLTVNIEFESISSRIYGELTLSILR